MRVSRLIHATPAALYHACTDPVALAAWRAPGDMTGKVHAYDGRVGGGYQMSLYYAPSDSTARGKSGAQEDRFSARYIELSPNTRIVEAITFDTTDPALRQEMTMIITFAEKADGTEVTIEYENLPPGIAPADNELGTRLSLAKLASYVEQ
jgi:uncharacterized protein YndB with AHSA1/START domain